MTLIVVLLVTAAVALAGCSDPYASQTGDARPAPRARAATPAAVEQDQRPGDAAPLRATRHVPPPSAATTASPWSLVRAYARESVNWDWRSMARHLRVLRSLSAGSLAAELDAAVVPAARDGSLGRDRPASRGHVLAVSITGRGVERRVVAVTREQQLLGGTAGLEGRRARVYTGAVVRTRAGWRLRAWLREP